jgi:hypothetical protein
MQLRLLELSSLGKIENCFESETPGKTNAAIALSGCYLPAELAFSFFSFFCCKLNVWSCAKLP